MKSDDRQRLWEEFLDAEFDFHQLRLKITQLYQNEDAYETINLLKKDLLDIRKRFFLYQVIESMPIAKQKLLAEELLPLAAMLETKRSVNPAEKIVLSWETEWLKKNLYKISRKVIERISAGEFTYLELGDFYSGLIGILRHFDLNKAREIIEEALLHSDIGVKETGISWRDDAKW